MSNSHQQVEHSPRHPNVHKPWQKWSEEQTLHVASVYSNPFRFRARRELFNDFRRRMESQANAVLHVAELAYGDRPFEVTEHAHPFDYQFRTHDELWHKENLLNLAVSRFPSDWKYGAFLDGDVQMSRHDWALEAVHLLQHFDFVQLYSTYSDLSPSHVPFKYQRSFASRYLRDGHKGVYSPDSEYGVKKTKQVGKPWPSGVRIGATGLGWAFRRDAFDHVGGFLDVCVLGSGDWYMGLGLVGAIGNRGDEVLHCSRPYQEAILAWQQRAAGLRRGIGCVDNHAIHYWHGSKQARGYGSRWEILRDHAFDPGKDIVRDWQGVWRWNGSKPRLRDDVRRYFLSRNEDGKEFTGGERELV